MRPEPPGKFMFQTLKSKNALFYKIHYILMTMVLILVFAAFAQPAEGSTGLWPAIFSAKWYITIALPDCAWVHAQGMVYKR